MAQLLSPRDAFYWRLYAPPQKLLPSEWAEEHRVLPAGTTPEPGRWRNSRTPYLVGIVDALVEPGVTQVVYVKPTQVGGSEVWRNFLGYCIHNDPGPALIVMPDEKSAREVVEERIRPMLEASPSLRAHLSARAWDTKQTSIKLDTMTIYVAWANSAQALASRPIRYLLPDEIDKYKDFVGREADPLSLARQRLLTFTHRAREFLTSTPTDREGAILRAFEACSEKRYFFVPCPLCHRFQRLVFPQVRWPRVDEGADRIAAADRIADQRLAYYECIHCRGRIDDHHKPKMLEAGRWATNDGAGVGAAVSAASGRRIGFHLNWIYSPWLSFSKGAAEWLRAKDDPGKTVNFRNSWNAEPFEEIANKPKSSTVRLKAEGKLAPPALIVPRWAQRLAATADTQKDHFYWGVRAWGAGWRSQLVHNGIAHSFEELAKVTLLARFRQEGNGEVCPQCLLIDSGGTKTDQGTSRTQEVYDFCHKDPDHIWPSKGAALKPIKPWSLSKLGAAGVFLRIIDTEFYKDTLARLISDPDEKKWMPNAAVRDDYILQMASEQKVRIPRSDRFAWVLVSSGAPNHWWDMEVLQVAAADMLEVSSLAEAAPAKPDDQRPRPEEPPDYVNAYRGRF